MSNVKDVDAVGDGAMDDTVATQYAIADGEGVAEFPAGGGHLGMVY